MNQSYSEFFSPEAFAKRDANSARIAKECEGVVSKAGKAAYEAHQSARREYITQKRNDMKAKH